MARPRKKGMAYFPHDTDAANDDKVEALRAIHGNNGYAFFFIILERVFSGENPEINLGIPALKLALARKVGVTLEEFNEILETALAVGAFDKEIFEETGFLTSNGIQKRFREVEDLRASWRDKKTKKVFPGENGGENDGENTRKTPQKEKEKEIKTFEPDCPEFILSELLLSEIRKNNPEFKEPNLQKWAADLDRILRVDGRRPEDVREVIKFAQFDSFWRSNILSPAKLRKQFDSLKMQMQSRKEPVKRQNQPPI